MENDLITLLDGYQAVTDLVNYMIENKVPEQEAVLEQLLIYNLKQDDADYSLKDESWDPTYKPEKKPLNEVFNEGRNPSRWLTNGLKNKKTSPSEMYQTLYETNDRLGELLVEQAFSDRYNPMPKPEDFPKGMESLSEKTEKASSSKTYWLLFRANESLQDTLYKQMHDPEFGNKQVVDLHEELKNCRAYDSKTKLHELGIDNDKINNRIVDYFIRLADGKKLREYFTNPAKIDDLFTNIVNSAAFLDTIKKNGKESNNLNVIGSADYKALKSMYELLIKKAGLNSTDLELIKPVLSKYLNEVELDKEVADQLLETTWLPYLKHELTDRLKLFNNENSKSIYTQNRIRKETPVLDTYLTLIKGFERFTNKKLPEEDKECLFEKFINDLHNIPPKFAKYDKPLEYAKELLVARLDVSAIEDDQELFDNHYADFKAEASPFKNKIDEFAEEICDSDNCFINTDAMDINHFMVPVLEEIAVTNRSPADIVNSQLSGYKVGVDSKEEIEDRIDVMDEWLSGMEEQMIEEDADKLENWLSKSQDEPWHKEINHLINHFSKDFKKIKTEEIANELFQAKTEEQVN